MIRPIGPRVLVRPVVVKASEIIELVREDYPQIADVIAVGAIRCASCGMPRIDPAITEGARIALRATTVFHEIDVDGETLWMVDLDDVIGEVEPLEVSA